MPRSLGCSEVKAFSQYRWNLLATISEHIDTYLYIYMLITIVSVPLLPFLPIQNTYKQNIWIQNGDPGWSTYLQNAQSQSTCWLEARRLPKAVLLLWNQLTSKQWVPECVNFFSRNTNKVPNHTKHGPRKKGQHKAQSGVFLTAIMMITRSVGGWPIHFFFWTSLPQAPNVVFMMPHQWMTR